MRDPSAYAIPFFFILMLLESYFLIKKKQTPYRLNDTFSNLGSGIGNRIITALISTFSLASYEWVYQHFSFAKFSSSSIWTWIIAFVLGDFIFYWWHRMSHRVNLFWAIHVVHHQSEDFNFGVALRQSWLGVPLFFPFLLLQAFIGLPTIPVFVCSALNLFYQFWVHTELIHKMGWYEKFMCAPTHHRVHHGINRQYLDKNYGGVFIVWDKLFGTFEPENEKVIYGTVDPLRKWSPFYANIEPWFKIARQAKKTPLIKSKLSYFFKSPEWTPSGSQLPPPGIPQQVKYDVSALSNKQTLLRMIPLLAFTYFFIWNAHTLSHFLRVVESLYILYLITMVAALIDGRKWAKTTELFNWLLIVPAVWAIL